MSLVFATVDKIFAMLLLKRVDTTTHTLSPFLVLTMTRDMKELTKMSSSIISLTNVTKVYIFNVYRKSQLMVTHYGLLCILMEKKIRPIHSANMRKQRDITIFGRSSWIANRVRDLFRLANLHVRRAMDGDRIYQ